MVDHTDLNSIRVNGQSCTSAVRKDWPAPADIERADRLAVIGQLAGGLAHEMNTPLASISAHAEESLEMLSGARLTPQQLAQLRERQMAIMRQAHRCSRVASRLLQFADPARPAGERAAPPPVVGEVVQLLAPSAEQRGVQLDAVLQEPLPAAPLAPAELEQLLLNLVQNAVDACQTGGRVRIEAASTDGELQFIVTDTGCGMSRDLLPRIFDPFFSTKPIGQGTGLGLSVCYGMVRAVGGSIEVESAPGRGTRVMVRLPCEPQPSTVVRTVEACPIGLGRPPDLRT